MNTIADVAARIIEIVQDHEGNPEELLGEVIAEVDDWGQGEYDRAVDDHFDNSWEEKYLD